MSFLGPFEAFKPLIDPFVGSSSRGRYEPPTFVRPDIHRNIPSRPDWERPYQAKVDQVAFCLSGRLD